MYWLDGRYDMDPIPLAEYCAQLQAAHDVNMLEGSLEDGENWYESSRWPALVDELQLIADVAPDEEEAEMWRVRRCATEAPRLQHHARGTLGLRRRPVGTPRTDRGAVRHAPALSYDVGPGALTPDPPRHLSCRLSAAEPVASLLQKQWPTLGPAAWPPAAGLPVGHSNLGATSL